VKRNLAALRLAPDQRQLAPGIDICDPSGDIATRGARDAPRCSAPSFHIRRDIPITISSPPPSAAGRYPTGGAIHADRRPLRHETTTARQSPIQRAGRLSDAPRNSLELRIRRPPMIEV